MQNVVRREGGSEYALYMGKEDSSQKPTWPLKKGLRQAAQSGAEAGGAAAAPLSVVLTGRQPQVPSPPGASYPLPRNCWPGGEAEKGVVRTRRHLRRGCWSGLATKNCEAETMAFHVIAVAKEVSLSRNYGKMCRPR